MLGKKGKIPPGHVEIEERAEQPIGDHVPKFKALAPEEGKPEPLPAVKERKKRIYFKGDIPVAFRKGMSSDAGGDALVGRKGRTHIFRPPPIPGTKH